MRLVRVACSRLLDRPLELAGESLDFRVLFLLKVLNCEPGLAIVLDLRDRSILELLYSTGMRRRETECLTYRNAGSAN